MSRKFRNFAAYKGKSESMSIKTSHLSKSFGKLQILTDLSFEIGPNEIVAFLGPNGAGKSTCMKILTGGLMPDAGEVLICNHSPFTFPKKARNRFGYLPENNPLYPEMYVQEYLEFVAGLHLITATHRIDEVMDLTLLKEVKGKTIGTLSRGFRQRVGLAAAILPDTPVLILDEPLSGLDPNQQEDILALLSELGTRKSILFSTHTLAEVEKIAERVLILAEGTLKLDRNLKELTAENSLESVFKRLTR